MGKIRGRIEGVNNGNTKMGKPKYGVTLGGGVWYNGWGVCPFEKGDMVDIEYEEREYAPGKKSNDIKQIVLVESETIKSSKEGVESYIDKDTPKQTQVYSPPKPVVETPELLQKYAEYQIEVFKQCLADAKKVDANASETAAYFAASAMFGSRCHPLFYWLKNQLKPR